MTVDGYDRRESDKRIDRLEVSLHKFIRASLSDHIVEHLERHHIDLTPAEAEAKVLEHDGMVKSMDRIVVLLEGEPVYDLSNTLIDRKGGMIAKQSSMSDTIDTIYARTNGGVKVTNVVNPAWTRNQKIGIGGLAVTIGFAALPGFVGFLHWLAEVWVL